MIIRKDKNKCYIEMGYNICSYEEKYWEFLVKLIKCFTKGEKKVLFEMVEWDKNLEEDKEEWAQEEFERFYDSYEWNEKSKINKPLEKILQEFYGGDNYENTEEMFNKFKSTSLEDVNLTLKENIKELVYENCCMWKLDNHDEEFQQFVKERIDFITDDWYFPREHELGYDKREGYIRTLWINIEQAENQIYWLKNKGDWFTCLIVDKDKKAEEYTYYLKYDELEPEPTMLLEVFGREEGIDDNILNNVKKLLEEHTKNS